MARVLLQKRLHLPKLESLPGGDWLQRWRALMPQCIPRSLRRQIALRNPRLLVRLRGNEAQLFRQMLDEREPIGQLQLGSPASEAPPSLRAPKKGWTAVCMELPADDVLLRKTTMPVQVRDNLRRVLNLEVDRLTPFASAEVYVDAHVNGLLARGTKLDVSLAVCRRDRAADWLALMRESGAAVDRLTWDGAWLGANLLPPEERPRRQRLGSLKSWALITVVLGLTVSALVAPVWQKTVLQEQLDTELRRVRVAAEEVTQVREQLERARQAGVEVLQRKQIQPRMADLLRELTDLLPDGTWVQMLNFRDGEVDIRGESDQATSLISLLERGPGISGVRYRSSVVQVPGTNIGRFHIAFTYSRAQTP